ncbi:Gfo/Idh/MocA family oxidoreductase [Plantactinospora sp. GCM10030261]|uniref:Gfo/Idh/MocA family oxidoreductase n=1 Tax=Plantactinospora sp. GCM10030261 TaxID=3273420 RepID=UPI003607137F
MSRLRFVVCGTTFGRVHLAALGTDPPWGRLVGVLARGSGRSVSVARAAGVPLYQEVDDLPTGVDAAVVAVRGAVAGGRGTDLATALMDRGIHVLQEHPLHHDELASCLRTARRNRVVYRVNNHYLHLTPIRRLVAATAALSRHGPIRYLDAGTGIQVAYALVDILARVLPSLRPWRLAPPVATEPPGVAPIRGVDGVIGGVPVGIRVHNELDPGDPDNHAHLLHRLAVITDAGTLTLADTHGPVLWSPRLHVVDGGDPAGERYLRQPTTRTLPGTEPTDYATVLRVAWPTAMAAAMADFAVAVASGDDPLRLGQTQLTVCRLWQDLTSRLGQPDLITGTPPPLITDELTELAA